MESIYQKGYLTKNTLAITNEWMRFKFPESFHFQIIFNCSAARIFLDGDRKFQNLSANHD